MPLDDLAPTPGQPVKISDLAAVLARKGVTAREAKVSADGLFKSRAAAVAVMLDGHAVAVFPGDCGSKERRLVKLRHAFFDTETVQLEEFRRRYSGVSLLLAEPGAAIRVQRNSGPDLRFDEYFCHLGEEHGGAVHTFRLENKGHRPLRITRVVASDAVRVTIDKVVLSPAMSGSIQVAVDAARAGRSQVFEVLLMSNDTVMPVTTLRVAWDVVSRPIGTDRAITVPPGTATGE